MHWLLIFQPACDRSTPRSLLQRMRADFSAQPSYPKKGRGEKTNEI